MSQALEDRLGRIRLAAFDVDGVFTDGRFYLSNDGVESKAFNTLDGYGVRRLLDAGIEVAIISGRPSEAVAMRMQELGVSHVYLACKNKTAAFEELLQKLDIDETECLYAGDDVPDLALLRRAGVSVAVANAHSKVHAECDFSTVAAGGFGAVREICDRLLAARET